MRLNAPKKNVFYIAIAFIVIGIVAFYIGMNNDSLSPHYGFWASTFGGMLLAAGSYFKGF